MVESLERPTEPISEEPSFVPIPEEPTPVPVREEPRPAPVREHLTMKALLEAGVHFGHQTP